MTPTKASVGDPDTLEGNTMTREQKPAMYVCIGKLGCYELRQERYRKYMDAGAEHPHDLCAIASSIGELKGMCEKHWPDTDFTDPENLGAATREGNEAMRTTQFLTPL
jgi:hypothetical protein